MIIINLILLFTVIAFVLLLKGLKMIYNIKSVKFFLRRAKKQIMKPKNLRDIFLGLFINSLFTLTNNGFSLINFLIALISFYVIIESNEKIEKG